MEAIVFEAALVLYFIAAAAGVLELFGKGKAFDKVVFGSSGAGFVLHTFYIIHNYVDAGHIPIVNPHEATSFFTWCVVLIFFVLEGKYRVKMLGSFAMPIALLLMLTAFVLPGDIKPLPPVLQSRWFGVHTFFAFMGNAAFAMAAGMGVMYLVQEHFVKRKHIGQLFGRMPSLSVLDDINYRLVSFGFMLYTLAMISGMLWADKAWGYWWDWADARQVWALITWLIYAVVVHSRVIAGWRGRRASVLAIIGFATVLVSFFGLQILKKGTHIFQ